MGLCFNPAPFMATYLCINMKDRGSFKQIKIFH